MSRGFNIYKLNHDVNKEIRESDIITKLDKFLYKDEYITYYILLFEGMPKLTMSYYYEDDDYVVDEWDGWNVTYPDPYEDD